MEELLSGAVKIDARTLADLLDYFVQLSRHINYFDLDLNISDWQPFFKKSIPFTLASIIKYQSQNAEDNFTLYNSLFEKKPSATGLQLNAFFIYYRFINNINEWHLTLKDSGLPLATDIEVLIKNKLREPVMAFIRYANAAVKAYGIRRIDFTSLYNNNAWSIDLTDLYAIDTSFSAGTTSRYKRLNNLYDDFKALYPAFADSIKLLTVGAEKNLEQSFIPLKEDLQKKHQPHLALLFAFLNMFRQLQDNLNQYTRKHLDFFYKDILQFKSAGAKADSAHVVFEIQKQLKNYLIKKGIKVKDGKDDNKQEILFSLDDDIVVTKTSIVDKRTLFLNNQVIEETAYLEGVYMAPNATKADGIDKDFDDDQPKNFPTFGSQDSKYILPGTETYKPYPTARIGFILASQVLLLHEGTRTITFNLKCLLDEKICSELAAINTPPPSGCCDDNVLGGAPASNGITYPNYLGLIEIYGKISDALNTKYYYISEDIIQAMIKKGIGNDLIERIRDKFLSEEMKICYCETKRREFDAVIPAEIFEPQFTTAELLVLADFIKKRKPLRLLFSGAKDWIEPSDTPETTFTIAPTAYAAQFTLTIVAVLNPDKDPVTFYNKDNLKEDFNTTLPLVKIELDDHFKIDFPFEPKLNACCLDKKFTGTSIPVSLYHFFRDVKLVSKIGANPNDHSDETQIMVSVCGLKNIIVQNDESVMDVNAPVIPFGARPKIGSNFYIGSEEIFLKKWSDIIININWKDKPVSFSKYYEGYQDFFIDAGVQDKQVKDDQFRVQISILQDGKWNDRSPLTTCGGADPKFQLFQTEASVPDLGCADDKNYAFQFALKDPLDFPGGFPAPVEKIEYEGIKRFDVNSRHSFIRVTLNCQDFQHDRYPFILARQMSALGKLPDIVDGAVYYGVTLPGPPPQFETLPISTILKELVDEFELSQAPINLLSNLEDLINRMNSLAGSSPGQITSQMWDDIFVFDDPISINPPHDLGDPKYPGFPQPYEHSDFHFKFADIINWLKKWHDKIKPMKDKGVVIPNEPWTPTISNMALDYQATSTLTNIDLIHLYPYDGTFKREELSLRPSMFPTFCDEGTLLLGLQDLVPGDNLNILFQLAEATSDSESDKEDVFWYYLENNHWKSLRKGFEVIDDATKNLTTSGIVKLSLPATMTKDNTVMPKNLHWIKAAIAKNSKAVSETIDIIPQAILTTFTNDDANDKLRLGKPLVAGSISKLNEADASVKSVSQPYDSFNGTVPEIENQFYVRVSETLRHKGRAIQAFDYERLALQAFPQLFKVKCINHSFALNAHEYINDFPYAPGYVILAVIPDLYKLKAGNSFEPKVPVSIIEDIETYIRKRTSPFVRFRAMNPRYEMVNFCLRVKLEKGKDENYFKEKLKQDIREFLAPWAVGVYDKLTFGQCIYRSDIIRLLETSDYVNFISEFRMGKADGLLPGDKAIKICPDTPRSILIAGDIDVCIEKPYCEDWSDDYRKCGDQGPVVAPCDTKPQLITDYCK